MAKKVNRVAPLRLRKGDELASWEEFLFRFDVAVMGKTWGDSGKGKEKADKKKEGGGVESTGGSSGGETAGGSGGGGVPEADRLKGAALFTAMGEEGQEVAMKWGLSLNSLSYTDLVRRFQERYQVCENVPLLRHRLMNMKQKGEEGLTGFVERVKGAANKCQLGEEYNSWVALFIVNGIRDDELRRKLLELAELTLDRVEAMCLRSDAAEVSAREFKGGEVVEVAKVEVSGARGMRCFTCGQEGHLVRECAKTRCYRCNGLGHTGSVCDRGFEAWRGGGYGGVRGGYSDRGGFHSYRGVSTGYGRGGSVRGGFGGSTGPRGGSHAMRGAYGGGGSTRGGYHGHSIVRGIEEDGGDVDRVGEVSDRQS